MGFKKILFDDEDDNVPSFESVFNDLPECIKDYYNEKVSDLKMNIIHSLNKCESPIEQLLALALEELTTSIRLTRQNIDVLEVKKQDEIKVGDNLYRADFCMPVYDMEKHTGTHFIVECDGHEFHQKTKEQVQKDYERTRILQSKGYIVIRFTGSEVYNSPGKCVNEVESIILSHFRTK